VIKKGNRIVSEIIHTVIHATPAQFKSNRSKIVHAPHDLLNHSFKFFAGNKLFLVSKLSPFLEITAHNGTKWYIWKIIGKL